MSNSVTAKKPISVYSSPIFAQRNLKVKAPLQYIKCFINFLFQSDLRVLGSPLSSRSLSFNYQTRSPRSRPQPRHPTPDRGLSVVDSISVRQYEFFSGLRLDDNICDPAFWGYILFDSGEKNSSHVPNQPSVHSSVLLWSHCLVRIFTLLADSV